MRFFEISEGIRMGSRELVQPTMKNYTIGFEYEVEVREGFTRQDDFDDEYDYSEGDEVDIEAAREEHEQLWDEGVRYDFDFNEWFEDYMRFSYRGGYNDFIIEHDIEPKHGWVEKIDDIVEYKNLEKIEEYRIEKRRIENQREKYNSEFIKKFKDFYENEYSEDIIDDKEKVKKYVFLFQMNNPKVKLRYPDENERSEVLKDAIKTQSYDTVKNVFMQDVKFFYEILIKEVPSPEKVTEEDIEFDPDDLEYIYDEYGNVMEVSEKINDLDDLTKYFDIDKHDIRELLDEDIREAENEAMFEDFRIWLEDNIGRFTRGSDSNNIISYVRDQIVEKLGENWKVTEDSSLTRGAEIITRVFPNLNTGIESMHKVFELIRNDEYIHTSGNTGLHINIGTWKGQEIHEVDWLKFLIIYKAERVLKEFDRITNMYSPDRLNDILVSLEKGNLKPFYEDIRSVNNTVIKISQKYSSINLSKLNSYGILELRAPGNKDYEKGGKYLEKEIRKIGRALDIASDSNAYRKEYAKKLYKLLSEKTEKRLGKTDNVVDIFFKKLTGGLIRDYKFLFAFDIITNIIRNLSYEENYVNMQVANTKYTSKVHRNIIKDLKEFQRINNINVKSEIEKMLNAYDTDDKLKNTKFIRLILRDLQKS